MLLESQYGESAGYTIALIIEQGAPFYDLGVFRERADVLMWDVYAETLSGGELEKIQFARLKSTLKRIWESGAPYREKMEEAGLSPGDVKSLEDLEKLPFSSKDDFRKNYPLGMLAVSRKDVVRIHASSGTTGTRTVVGYTENDIENWAQLVARIATAAGVTREDIAQISFTYGLFTGGFGLHYGLEKLGAMVIPVSGGQTELQMSVIMELKPSVLISTPTYALYLSELGKEMGIDLPGSSLRVGLFGAEPWSEEIRARIESGLGILATDNYGLSEVTGPGVAGECHLQNGLHIAEDHFIAEIVDEKGKPVGEGKQGELVLTTLTREAMPVIRFRTGDLTSITRAECECGRKNARMSRVVGRADDMLIIKGVNVYPSQIERALLEVAGVEPHYLIVVDRRRGLDVLEVWVEVSEGLFSDDAMVMRAFEEKIEAHIKSTLNVRASVRLKEPRTFDRTSGKAKRVIDLRREEPPDWLREELRMRKGAKGEHGSAHLV